MLPRLVAKFLRYTNSPASAALPPAARYYKDSTASAMHIIKSTCQNI
jgi:hypothetical protein